MLVTFQLVLLPSAGEYWTIKGNTRSLGCQEMVTILLLHKLLLPVSRYRDPYGVHNYECFANGLFHSSEEHRFLPFSCDPAFFSATDSCCIPSYCMALIPGAFTLSFFSHL
jgi:hypothetical protein